MTYKPIKPLSPETAAKPKVLFVDDEEAILRSLSWTFDEDPEIDVLTTSDPRRALSLINTQEISVLVTDERMPDLPGHQLVKHCKTLSPNTLTMVMSGYADTQPMVQAMLAGKILRFLIKPWQPEGIVHTIKQALKLVQYQQERRQSMKQLAQAANPTVQPTTLEQRMARLKQQNQSQPLAGDHTLAPQAKTAQLEQLKCAGLLYNVDQLPLPADLREHLRLQQLCLMKDHSHLVQHYQPVLISAALIERLNNATEASHWVLAHTEHYNGKGGPFGLKGALIPMGARVLAIAIAFVAAHDKTLYLAGHTSLNATLAHLKQQAGITLDPHGVALMEQYTEADWLTV